MRELVKAAAERCLTSRVGPALRRRVSDQETLVLAYHNIVPHGADVEGDQSLHLPQAEFAAQLDSLVKTHDVVPLNEVLDEPLRRNRRPRAAITFDDGYRGSLTAGVAELAARSLPATFFVVPGLPEDTVFWWDALTGEETGILGAEARARGLSVFAGDSERIRKWSSERGQSWRPVPQHARVASSHELKAAVESAGITVGSHTWTHPNLAAIPADAVVAELKTSLEWLQDNFPRSFLPWLSYPYGISTPVAESVAAAVGYVGAVRIDGGWVPAKPDHKFAIPRLNIPNGTSSRGFLLRTSGIICR